MLSLVLSGSLPTDKSSARGCLPPVLPHLLCLLSYVLGESLANEPLRLTEKEEKREKTKSTLGASCLPDMNTTCDFYPFTPLFFLSLR